MQIIRATPAHVSLIAPLFDLYRQFYKQSSDVDGATRFLSERLSRDESVIFLALKDAACSHPALGFTQLYPSFSSTSMRRLWILNDLYVVSAARKHGVGRALMDRARQFAIETGAEGLALETATDNFTAQRLYESLHWKKDDVYFRYNLVVG
jgi:GNAT superfamily N-acetyltransferase